MTSSFETKSPLERSVRDMFKPPLEREYRDLIESSTPPNHLQASSSETMAPPPSVSQVSDDTYPLVPAPPPYHAESADTFPEKTAPATDNLIRVESCETIGHDIQLSACQRKCRIIYCVLCPELMAYLMLKKRTCKRCGMKVRPKTAAFH